MAKTPIPTYKLRGFYSSFMNKMLTLTIIRKAICSQVVCGLTDLTSSLDVMANS